MSAVLLDVRGLHVCTKAGREPVLDGVDLTLHHGQRMALVGESGAGKTTLALAALGVVRPGLQLSSGAVRLDGEPVTSLGEAARRRLRWRSTAWLSQEPASALTPTMTVERQVAEALGPGGGRGGSSRQAGSGDVVAALAAFGLPTDGAFLRRLPAELSGGQQQRLAVARAVARRPRLLVLDEPTSKLDPASRELVLAEVDRLQRLLGFAVLLVTHDDATLARAVDDVVVLAAGRVVERSTADARVLTTVQRPPVQRPPRMGAPVIGRPLGHQPVLTAQGLVAGHGGPPVLRGASLELLPGAGVAVTGRSGCGKSTLARLLVGLHPPDAGQVLLAGAPLAGAAAGRSRAQRAAVQLVPQDAAGSLHPRRSVAATLTRPLRLLHGLSADEAREQVDALLGQVGLAAALARRWPHQLSGGQRQRVAVARALAVRPQVLVCDEVTSALDPRTAAGLLELLRELRERDRVALLLFTHDLPAASRATDDALVLHEGRLAGSAAPACPVPERAGAGTSERWEEQ